MIILVKDIETIHVLPQMLNNHFCVLFLNFHIVHASASASQMDVVGIEQEVTIPIPTKLMQPMGGRWRLHKIKARTWCVTRAGGPRAARSHRHRLRAR